jgi:hypothetical protein
MSSVKLAQHFRENYGHRLLARPFFVEKSMLDTVSADLIGLYRILADLPATLFDGDVVRYCEYLGVDQLEAALLHPVDAARPSLYGRADLYRTGSEFRLLEYNVGSRVGGADIGELCGSLLSLEPFRDFAEEFRLDYVDPSAELASSLLEQAATIGRGENPVVALLEADVGLAAHAAGYGSVAERLRAFGLDLRLGELGQLRTVGRDLFIDGTRIDVVLRFFSVGQIRDDQQALDALHALRRAHERGRVVVFTPFESYLPANKGALAILSDPRWRAAFTAEEIGLIDSYVPWTRLLRSDVQGDLLDQCRAERADIILKPGNGHGGGGIVAGWETGDREWQEALVSGRAAGFVVQRRVVPTPEEVVDPETGEIGTWLATWGPFVTDRGGAGAYIRAVPTGAGAVVSYGGVEATRVTGVYSFS